MSYLDRLYACNNFESTHYRALLIDGKVYGQITPDFAAHLAQWADIFTVTATTVVLNPALGDYATRTAAVAPVFRALYEQGVIDSWVAEAYPITHRFGGHAELEIERAATNFMGVKTFGIHVNGLVQTAKGIDVWVATRSLDKPFWPGKLDQMVAGGQPVGLGLLENVIKESQEEANIPPALAQQAQAIGTIPYQQEGWRGLDNSTIYVYDLWLPDDFVPENTDGEVIAFERMPLAEIARLTETTEEFKDNCNLVNVDLLLRNGLIAPQHPEYAAILNILYNAGNQKR
ncbi:MAG: NUDIX hydrolase [Thiothrix lacustris]|uniref:NUDIX hydrolase n=1 Tax=Thiothrix lacustris TaxID=525917 RepID=A0A1Y1QGW4_9GAMM|nr:MAG: NUDIX hydrolase [Thiothrix lacustris]